VKLYLWDKTNKKGIKRGLQLIEDMKAGSVHTLIMSGVNPVYTLADTASFVEGLKVVTSVSLTLKEHETALVSTIAARFHYLEAWGDLSITKGLIV
jgi:molybdopterin-containing oxidoreductase family iron-sulfur binding subunit